MFSGFGSLGFSGGLFRTVVKCQVSDCVAYNESFATAYQEYVVFEPRSDQTVDAISPLDTLISVPIKLSSDASKKVTFIVSLSISVTFTLKVGLRVIFTELFSGIGSVGSNGGLFGNCSSVLKLHISDRVSSSESFAIAYQ